MMVLTRLLAALPFALLLLVGDALARTENAFTSGEWTGRIHYADGTGRFLRCSISATYASGITLQLGINRNGQTVIFLNKDSWKLEKGRRYPVTLRVDDWPAEFNVLTASGPRLGWIRAKRTDDLATWLRRGNTLYIETDQTVLTFKLTGTHKALDRARACAIDALAAEQRGEKGNPFAGARGSGPSGPRDDPLAIALDRNVTYLKWAAQARQVYTVALESVEVAAKLDELTLSYQMSEVNADYARSRFESLVVDFASSLKRAEHLYAGLEPPRFSPKDVQQAAMATYDYLGTLQDRSRANFKESSTFFDRALSGQRLDPGLFISRKVSGYVDLVNGETKLLRAGLHLSQPGHPQRNIVATSIIANDFLASLMGDMIVSVFASTDRQPSNFDYDDALDRFEKEIRDGRKNNETVFGGLQRRVWPDAVPADRLRRLRNLARKIKDNYGAAFDVEQSILDLLKDMKKLGHESQETWQKMAFIDSLVDRRQDLQGARIALVEDLIRIAGAIKASEK